MKKNYLFRALVWLFAFFLSNLSSSLLLDDEASLVGPRWRRRLTELQSTERRIRDERRGGSVKVTLNVFN